MHHVRKNAPVLALDLPDAETAREVASKLADDAAQRLGKPVTLIVKDEHGDDICIVASNKKAQ